MVESGQARQPHGAEVHGQFVGFFASLDEALHFRNNFRRLGPTLGLGFAVNANTMHIGRVLKENLKC